MSGPARTHLKRANATGDIRLQRDDYNPLTATPPDDTPSKRKRGGALSQPEMFLHCIATTAFKRIMEIYAAVSVISSTKWASLDAQLDDRLKNASLLFQAIVLARKSDYNIQHPVRPPKDKEQLARTQSLDPSPPEQGDKDHDAAKKLESYLGRLLTRMGKYLSRLKDDNMHQQAKRLADYELLLWKHYSSKIDNLPGVVEIESKEDLLTKVPTQEFTLLTKMKTHRLLTDNPTIREVFEPVFFHAQAVYDRYKASWSSYHSCELKMEYYAKLHAELSAQLFAAKSLRRFKDEDHAQAHIVKVQRLCEEQSRVEYCIPKSLWKDFDVRDPLPPKPLQVEGNCGWKYVVGSEKGGRSTKEHIEDKVLSTSIYFTMNGKRVTLPLFAVMDGHGGNGTSNHCQQHLPKTFVDALARFNAKAFSLDGILNAMKETCLALHDGAPPISGSTLLFATCIENVWYVASVGDSRGMVMHDRPIPMTYDADASDPYFQEQVQLRHGEIVLWRGSHRVEGLKLNLTHTIGDKLDASKLNRNPMINVFEVPAKTKHNIYLLLCSDGLTSMVSHQQLYDYIRAGEKAKMPMQDIAGRILHRGMTHNQDPVWGDDVSLILVKLNK